MSEANETLRSMPSTTRSLKASNLQRAAGGASLSETDSLFRSVVGPAPYAILSVAFGDKNSFA
jgi:hypothetical protein